MKNAKEWLLVSALCSAVGCGVNDKDLSIAAAAYHATDSKASLSQKYDLLSKAAKEQLTLKEFEELSKPPEGTTVSEVKVLGEQEQEGKTFAKVQFVYSDSACKSVGTATWVKEDGRWRRLYFPKLAKKTTDQYSSGDYSAALATAEEWLAHDPFSIDGLSRYAFSQLRSRTALVARGNRSREDVVRSVLAVNKSDHDALFIAATYTDAPGIARSFLEQLPDDSCVFDDALFNVANKFKTASDRLALLEAKPSKNAMVVAVRVSTLNELDRHEDALNLLRVAHERLVSEFASSGDPSFSAHWAAKLGEVAIRAGDIERGRQWFEIGVAKDPQDKLLAILDRRLNDSCCRDLRIEVEPLRKASNGYGGTYAFFKITNKSSVSLDRLSLSVRLLDANGDQLSATSETEWKITPGQTRTVRSNSPWTPASKVSVFDVQVDAVDVSGHRDLSPPFWVRVERREQQLSGDTGP